MSEEWPDLRKADWSDLSRRLVLFALGRMRGGFWRGQVGGAPPGAVLAQDFVHSAIAKALSGERNYDSTRTLFENLCQIISSEISNSLTSYENKNSILDDDGNIINIEDFRRGPEEEVIDKDMAEKLLAHLRNRDAEAASLAEVILREGATQNLELSREMNLSVSAVLNAKKRLRRLLHDYKSAENRWPAASK